jgi:TetR/AcrR family transcriptional regulator, transcriptional repressor of aconitase
VPKVSEAHRVERRRQILEGARRVFSEHGYYGTNVGMLEAEIGLSRGAIFNYFPSKLELFIALAREDNTRVAWLWLEFGFEAVVRHIGEEDPEWIGVYLEVGRLLRTDPVLREQWSDLSGEVQERIAQRYVEVQQKGEIRGDLSVETMLGFLGTMINGLVVQQGAGFAIDVEGTLELVRSALSPK